MFLGTLMVLVRAVPSMRDTHTQNTCIYSHTHTHTHSMVQKWSLSIYMENLPFA